MIKLNIDSYYLYLNKAKIRLQNFRSLKCNYIVEFTGITYTGFGLVLL